MIQHIIWDWNGTLIDDVPACVKSLNDMLRKYGRKPVTCAQYRAKFGFPVQDYYVRLGFDFSRDNWKQVAVEFHDAYRVHSKAVRLRRGARKTLEHLQRMGINMSILSASETSILERMVGDRGIRKHFSGLYGLGDLFARSKLEAGHRLLAAVKTDPTLILLVGDTVHDCEVAAGLRCRCVLIRGGHQTEARLRQTGCDVLPDVKSLLRYVART